MYFMREPDRTIRPATGPKFESVLAKCYTAAQTWLENFPEKKSGKWGGRRARHVCSTCVRCLRFRPQRSLCAAKHNDSRTRAFEVKTLEPCPTSTARSDIKFDWIPYKTYITISFGSHFPNKSFRNASYTFFLRNRVPYCSKWWKKLCVENASCKNNKIKYRQINCIDIKTYSF